MRAVSIPQYPLRSPDGTPIPFELLDWGSGQTYDHHHPHRHHFYEILIFEAGGGRHDIDFATHMAIRNTVHFVGPDNVHMLLRDSASQGLSMTFDGDFLPDAIVRQLPFSTMYPALQLSDGQMAEIVPIIQAIRMEQQSQRPYAGDIICAHMQTLMLHLLRAYQATTDIVDSSSLHETVRSFQQLVGRHYSDHYSVETYASLLSISPKHLIELCRKHTGKTPLQYIRAHMVTEAKRLLFHTQMPVKEIAYKLKFDEPANFSKYFKSAAGYTPDAYRKGIKVKNG